MKLGFINEKNLVIKDKLDRQSFVVFHITELRTNIRNIYGTTGERRGWGFPHPLSLTQGATLLS